MRHISLRTRATSRFSFYLPPTIVSFSLDVLSSSFASCCIFRRIARRGPLLPPTSLPARSWHFSRIPVHVSSLVLPFLPSSFSVTVATRGKNPPRPNDDVTLVHDSPRRITSGFLFPFVQNEKQDREGRGKKGGG